MKLFLVAALLFVALLTTARAQSDADDRYIGIYGLIQQADQLGETGDPGEALAAFGDAQTQLKQFQAQYPNWNPNIISFRLSHIGEKMADLKARIPTPPPAITNAAPSVPVANTSPAVAATDDMRVQLQAAVAANESLQAKLKEALAVQPAAVDPIELERAKQKIEDLMKENDLLKASRAVAGQPKMETQVVTNFQVITNFTTTYVTNNPEVITNFVTTFVTNNPEMVTNFTTTYVTNNPEAITNFVTTFVTNAPEVVTNFVTTYITNAPEVVTNFVTTYITNSPEVVTNFATVYVTNTTTLVVTNVVQGGMVEDTNALEMLRLERAAAVRNFNDEHDRAEQLDAELSKLRQGIFPADTNAVALAALQTENASLKAQLEKLNAAASANAEIQSNELNQAQAQIASLQAAAETLGREKTELQQKLAAAASATNAVAATTNVVVDTADFEARIHSLTQERDDLSEKLDLLNKQKSGPKNTELLAQLSALNAEVTILRARLTVVEAPPVAYSADELALFKSNVPKPATPAANEKSITEMPAGTMQLVNSAQDHFAKHEYDQAEADYQKILDRDQNNGIALANLATIELQENKLDDAEKHIKAALAQSPDDAYNLSTLGYLKFRQGKYDEALNALSRAAQIDPNNPEIQNYLGVTLSHQGQRKAAESALRRAVQLAPNYAPAHNNLAVIYLSQNPPMAEMARWHYQKAIDAGQPRNPDLEKMLADKGAPFAQ